MTSDTMHAESRSAVATGSSSDDTGGGFPTETLPPRVKQFVEECAASLPAPPDFVALPALVTVGASIGNARVICLKDDWDEPAALYGAIVGDPGTMKSQALHKATEPLQREETDTRRTWTSDTTVERLGGLLEENPRGLLLERDELSGWVKSLNQYKPGGRGADRQFYLSAWNNLPINVDRKGGLMGSSRIRVQRPFLSVIGCIPPDVLPELQERNGQQDGFTERLLFAWPKPFPNRWTDATVSSTARTAYQDVIHELVGLGWPAPPTPVPLPFTPDAQRCFREWVDSHLVEMESPELPQTRKVFWAKLKGYCARLALIHALATDPQAKEIGELSVLAAAAQVDYFKAQAAKVADRLCRSVGVGKLSMVDPKESCRQEIRRKLAGGRSLTKRDLQRSSMYDSKIFNPAFESLLKPELVRLDGKFALSDSISLDRHTDTDIMREITSSTDIPTTDTKDNGSGGKE